MGQSTNARSSFLLIVCHLVFNSFTWLEEPPIYKAFDNKAQKKC